MSRFAKGLLVVYAAHALNGVIGALTVPFMVRALGLSGYGLLSVYALIVGYVGLADVGLGKNLLRLLSETDDPSSRRRSIGVALGLYLLLATALILASPLFAIVIPRYMIPVPVKYIAALRIIIVMGVLDWCIGIPASVMQTMCVAEQRFERYARYSLSTGIVRNVVMLAGALFVGSPAGIAVLLASRRILDVFLAGNLLGWLPLRSWKPTFSINELLPALRQSSTLSTAQVLNWIFLSIGSLLVNAVAGLQGLGTYRAAFDLAGKIAFISNGVTLVAFPRAARYFAREAEHRIVKSVVAAAMRCSSAVYGAYAAAAVLCAPAVLPVIGLRDSTTIRMFCLLTVALSVNAHSLLGNELIQAAGKYSWNIYYSFSGLVSLLAIFGAAMFSAGTFAIAWAWIGAALISACVVDCLVLRLIRSGNGAFTRAVLTNVAGTAACLGLTGWQTGFVSSLGLINSLFVVGLLLLVAIRNIIPFLRERTARQISAAQLGCA